MPSFIEQLRTQNNLSDIRQRIQTKYEELLQFMDAIEAFLGMDGVKGFSFTQETEEVEVDKPRKHKRKNPQRKQQPRTDKFGRPSITIQDALMETLKDGWWTVQELVSELSVKHGMQVKKTSVATSLVTGKLRKLNVQKRKREGSDYKEYHLEVEVPQQEEPEPVTVNMGNGDQEYYSDSWNDHLDNPSQRGA